MSARITLGCLVFVLCCCSQVADVGSIKTKISSYENEAMWNGPRKDSFSGHIRWRESLGNSYIDPELLTSLEYDLRMYIRSRKSSVDLSAVFKHFGVSEHLIRAIMSNPDLRKEVANETDLRLKACRYLRSNDEHGTAMFNVYSRFEMLESQSIEINETPIKTQ